MPSFDSKSDHLKRLLLIVDLVILTIVFLFVMFVYVKIKGGVELNTTLHLGLLPVLLVVFAAVRNVFGHGLDIRKQNLPEQSFCLLKETSLTLAMLGVMLFLLRIEGVSRIILVGSLVAGAVALLVVRRVIIWWVFSRRNKNIEDHLGVLIIGSGRRARMLADQLQNSSAWAVNIVGFLDPKGESAGRRAGDEILGHVDDISEVLRDNVVEDVIVAVPRSMMGDIQAIVNACQEEGVRLRFMANIYDFDAARISLHLVNGIPLLGFEPVAQEEGPLFAKRIFDLVLTIAAIPFLLPIFVIVAVVIKLESDGPVFFRQERIGLHKRRFQMFKFRSMSADAEQRMSDVEHLNEASGPNFKIENDPRLTRVGRFLRKTSIDELPQLLNVLSGEMSLVGPRPMSVRDVDLFDQGSQRKRFSVRPGITCLWQVSGRSDLSFDDWLALDLQYIDTWSFWLDIKILLMTVPTVLRGQGAV